MAVRNLLLIFSVLVVGGLLTWRYGLTAHGERNHQVLDLTCNADCSLISFSVLKGGEVRSFLYDSRKELLQEIIVEGEGSLNQINLFPDPVALVGQRIVEVDLEGNRFHPIYEGERAVFYPTKVGKEIYFSEQLSEPSRTSRNPNQRRALFKFDVVTGERKRLLPGILAYQIGRPFLANQCIAIKLGIPFGEQWPPSKMIERSSSEPWQRNLSFCFSQEDIVKDIDPYQLISYQLISNLKSVERSSVDKNLKYAVIYSIDSGPKWRVIRLGSENNSTTLSESPKELFFMAPTTNKVVGLKPIGSKFEIVECSLDLPCRLLVATDLSEATKRFFTRAYQ
ncbi:hypothetical protein B7H23_04265 [Notoacmeibacter marinus]|uniref:Uncharacterized protein n=1 Tax=Notoacmeibacter marinus TaxID=1876515 RepID=A0A231V1T5_9HYPH|nr:hypothetical protein [Notoacmeibacter marinus]OXT02142.1 hypothetical protein B7H23_04265 [Notoacmeibacter marinus]